MNILSFFYCTPEKDTLHITVRAPVTEMSLFIPLCSQQSTLISVLQLFEHGVYVIRLPLTCFSSLSFSTNDLDNAVTVLSTHILATLVLLVPVQSN